MNNLIPGGSMWDILSKEKEILILLYKSLLTSLEYQAHFWLATFRMVISMQNQPTQMVRGFREQILKEETSETKVGAGYDCFL